MFANPRNIFYHDLDAFQLVPFDFPMKISQFDQIHLDFPTVYKSTDFDQNPLDFPI